MAAAIGSSPWTFWRYKLTKKSTAKRAKKLRMTVTTPSDTDRLRKSRGGTSGAAVRTFDQDEHDEEGDSGHDQSDDPAAPHPHDCAWTTPTIMANRDAARITTPAISIRSRTDSRLSDKTVKPITQVTTATGTFR